MGRGVSKLGRRFVMQEKKQKQKRELLRQQHLEQQVICCDI